jgi:hypothetical protein
VQISRHNAVADEIEQSADGPVETRSCGDLRLPGYSFEFIKCCLEWIWSSIAWWGKPNGMLRRKL